MNRKTIKSVTRGVHITLPIRLLEEFDETLGYKESRSKKIATLMTTYVRNDDNPLTDYSRRELIEHLQWQYDKDSPEDILIQALLALH